MSRSRDGAVLSTLGRPIDPSYPSNRYAAIVAPAVGLVAATVVRGGGAPWWPTVRWGLGAAAAAFLAWALVRELDPDRPWTAGVAALAAPAVAAAGPPAPGAVLVVLLAARVAARSTGLAPTILDLVGVGALAVYVARTGPGLAAAVSVVCVLAVDRILPGGAPAGSLVAALVVGAGVSAVAVIWGGLPAPETPTVWQWVLAGVSLTAGLAGMRAIVVRSTADLTGVPLAAARVRLARGIALFAAIFGAAWAGGPGITAMAPVWVAVVAAAAPHRV